MPRTFDEIAEAQGWDNNAQLDLLRQYIANQDADDALADFAEQAAEIENAFAEPNHGDVEEENPDGELPNLYPLGGGTR